MSFYCIKFSMFGKLSHIKIKRKIDGKINLYYRCIDCIFKELETRDKEKPSDLLKV